MKIGIDGNDGSFPWLMLFLSVGGARILARDHPDNIRKKLMDYDNIKHALLQVWEDYDYYT